MPMISFRDLFRFSQKEVSFVFDHIIEKKYYRGLKVLKATLPQVDQPQRECSYGKMLIITPRASGKATQRNRIRRQIKNIYFQEKCYLSSFAWIVIVSNKATTIPFDGLKKFLITTMGCQPTPGQEQP